MSLIRIYRSSLGPLPRAPSEEDVDETPIKGNLLKCRRQAFAALIVGLGMFSVGTVFGWASFGVNQVRQQGYIHNSTISNSLMASIYLFTAVGGGPAVGITMRRIGRRMACFIYSVLLSFGWMLITITRAIPNTIGSEIVILTGRGITGFACSALHVVGVIYIQETADESVRTKLGNMVPFLLTLGNTLCFAIGSFTPWWALSIICFLFPMVQAILMWILPDPPRYLLTVKKHKKAEKAFHWYYAGFTPSERERLFKRLKHDIQILDKSNDQAMKRAERAKAERRQKLRLRSRPVLHPLLISLFLLVFQQSSGINVVNTFAEDFLKRGEDFLKPEYGMMILGIVYFFVVLMTMLVVDKLGRKPLILVGTSIQTVLLIVLGLFFYYSDSKKSGEREFVIKYFSWLPVFTCTLFMSAYAGGIGSVTWILVGEINHPDFSEISGALTSLTYWLVAGLSTATMPFMKDLIGYPASFWVYSGSSFGSFLFAFFFIYETKGKTQEQIMAHYKGTTYDGEDDDEAETASLGSIKHGGRRSRDRRKMSGDSDWSTDFTSIYETKSEEIEVPKQNKSKWGEISQ